jgi:predicted phage terminase large subunit-like protein
MRLADLAKLSPDFGPCLEDLLGPATATESVPFVLPSCQAGPQTDFFNTVADIAIGGGSAGGGKSFALLIDAARFAYMTGYSAVLFRRSSPQIRNPGSLWDTSALLYPQMGAKPLDYKLSWEFPSGAMVTMKHLQHEKTKMEWMGAQLARAGWDELTHFTESQFFYLLSRMRSTLPLTPQVRCTCNPEADSWVARFIDWWIGPEGYPIPERSGVLRYFYRVNGVVEWGDSAEELIERYPKMAEVARPKSVTFISMSVYDNPALLKDDPDYLSNLLSLHPVEMERLLKGNWRIRFDAGKVFNRKWFKVVDFDAVPDNGVTLRFWDMAATAKEVNEDACFTAGVKMRLSGDNIYVLDCIAEQVGPADGDQLMLDTANQDGRFCDVRWELEGGSSGPKVAAYLSQMLEDFDTEAIRPQGDKLTRAKPLARAASQGRVFLVRGAWNDTYLSALHTFDGLGGEGADIVDASSGAYNCLTDALPLDWFMKG